MQRMQKDHKMMVFTCSWCPVF